MKDRKYYQKLYTSYPDVVVLDQLREMLGGIAKTTVRKLLKSNSIKHYVVNYKYLIPKTWIIDYVVSGHYEIYKNHLKHQV